jgi:predicted nucleic acid-binding protein
VTSTSGEGHISLLDTSVAIAFLVGDHTNHDRMFEALSDRRLGLSGHAAFETFSVLTRLPAGNRVTPATAFRIIESNFPDTRYLSAKSTGQLSRSFARLTVAGGSVYDALVGATAAEHGLPLVTSDRRALAIYRELEVDVEFVA